MDSSYIKFLSIGTNEWGSRSTPPATVFRILDVCRDRGVTLIDTAPVYPSIRWSGVIQPAEECIGKYFEDKSLRRNFNISTKFRHIYDFSCSGSIEQSIKNNIAYSVDQSLHRLKTDYLDEICAYNPVSEDKLICSQISLTEYLGVVIEILENLRLEGKILNYGMANENIESLNSILHTSHENGDTSKLDFLQQRWSLLDQDIDQKIIETLEKHSINLHLYGVLGQGYLTGKYFSGKMLLDSRKFRVGGMHQYESKSSLFALRQYVDLCESNKISLQQLALQSRLVDGQVKRLVVGVKNVDQLLDAINSMTKPVCISVLKEALHQYYECFTS